MKEQNKLTICSLTVHPIADKILPINIKPKDSCTINSSQSYHQVLTFRGLHCSFLCKVCKFDLSR